MWIKNTNTDLKKMNWDNFKYLNVNKIEMAVNNGILLIHKYEQQSFVEQDQGNDALRM